MSNKPFKQDQRVYFSLGDNKPEGWATVVGVQGFIVIIKPEKPVKDYAFSHIYVIDSQISNGPKTKIHIEDPPAVATEVKNNNSNN